MSVQIYSANFASRLEQYFQLTKPRVVALIVFTAMIGMLLATDSAVPLRVLFSALSAYGWSQARPQQ